MRLFKCDNCKQLYKSGWTEEEAQAEYDGSLWNVPSEPTGTLCNDCFEFFKEWFAKQTPADLKRMREQNEKH